MSRREDEILRDYWRTTARAPRPYPGAKSYDLGLDVLGALPVGKTKVAPPATKASSTKVTAPPPAAKPPAAAVTSAKVTAPPPAAKPPVTNSTATKPRVASPPPLSKAVAAKANTALNKAQSAASHAMSTASKLAKYHPQMASALRGMSANASKVATRLSALKANPPVAKVPSGAAIMGDGTSDATVDAGASTTSLVAGVTEQAAVAGDIAVQILPVIDQLKQKGDATSISLAQEGQSIVDLCNKIVQTSAEMVSSNTGGSSM